MTKPFSNPPNRATLMAVPNINVAIDVISKMNNDFKRINKRYPKGEISSSQVFGPTGEVKTTEVTFYFVDDKNGNDELGWLNTWVKINNDKK
jgi:hypothetical protein